MKVLCIRKCESVISIKIEMHYFELLMCILICHNDDIISKMSRTILDQFQGNFNETISADEKP